MSGWLGRAIGSLFGINEVERTFETAASHWDTSSHDIREFLNPDQRREYNKLFDDYVLGKRGSEEDKEKAAKRLHELHAIAKDNGF